MHDLNQPDEKVPGVLARRLAQFGSPGALKRLILKAATNDAVPALSVDLVLHELVSEGELDSARDWIKMARFALRFKPDSFSTAALNGHAAVVAWMLHTHPSSAPITPTLIRQVAALGLHDVMAVLQDHTALGNDVPLQERHLKTPVDNIPSPGPTPISSDAATSVLLSPVLRSQIYSFRTRPTACIKNLEYEYRGERPASAVPGLLMRLALRRSELHAVKQVYLVAENMRFTGAPKLSLSTAMHDAAVAGRVDVLAWLRLQCGVGHCRPHTMAATVRAGWSHVVRWLHANAPESTLSMTTSPLVDAARWGLLDVLRTCHELKIPGGRVDAHDRATWSQATLDAAIVHDHTSLVSWLAGEFHIVGSSDAVKHVITDGNLDMLRTLHELNAIAAHSVDAGMIEIANAPALSTLIEFAVAHKLLSDRGACQVSEVIFMRASDESQVSILRKLIANYTHYREAILFAAIRQRNENATSTILQTNALPQGSLLKAVEISVAQGYPATLSILVSYAVQHRLGDALPLLSSHGELSFTEKLFPYRTQTQAIAALAQATSLETLAFLLRNEDTFFTEAALLASIPSCLSAAYIRHLLKHERYSEGTKVRCFASVLDEDRLPLTLGELKTIRTRQDQALNAFLRKHASVLISFDAFDGTAAADWRDVYEYLRSINVPLPVEALHTAVARGSEEEVEWLLRVGGMGVDSISAPCVRVAASQPSHTAVLELLHRHDFMKSSHEFRLGIRLAYEDALNAGNADTARRLESLGAVDLSLFRLVSVAEQGHVELAISLADRAATGEAVDAITRATERGHWRVVVALLDARPDLEMGLGLRVQLAGFAFRAGELKVAKKLVNSQPINSKKRQLVPSPCGIPRSKKRTSKP